MNSLLYLLRNVQTLLPILVFLIIWTSSISPNILKSHTTMAHLGPGVLLAEQVSVEVGHLPVPLVCEAPHQLPVAHVVELLPLLLSLTALLKALDSLAT